MSPTCDVTEQALPSPYVSVVIVGYNNVSDIQRCLVALSVSSYHSFEVIICENGGREPFSKLLDTVPPSLPGGQNVKLIASPSNLGFAGGVNFALQHAVAQDAIWILNPDTEPASDAMEHLAGRLARGDCDAVGCTIILPSGLIQSYGGHWSVVTAHATSLGFGSNPVEKPDTNSIERAQNYLNGASMFVSRHFLEVTGLMREEYFLYCEEVEWCLRARRLNMRLAFCAEAHVLHYHGTTTGLGDGIRGASPLAIYLSERNRLLVVWDYEPIFLIIASPLALVRLVARCFRHHALHQLAPGTKGWWAGFRNRRSTIK
jgi:N-acetylglucosaminyl-diphospho-decaprenol L-rhamnosyltransferase